MFIISVIRFLNTYVKYKNKFFSIFMMKDMQFMQWIKIVCYT